MQQALTTPSDAMGWMLLYGAHAILHAILHAHSVHVLAVPVPVPCLDLVAGSGRAFAKPVVERRPLITLFAVPAEGAYGAAGAARRLFCQYDAAVVPQAGA